MKITYLPFLILTLISCNHSSSHNQQAGKVQGNSEEKHSANNKTSNLTTDQLIGNWVIDDKQNTNVTFKISKHNFYYPDAQVTNPYTIKGDTIKMTLEDGYIESFPFSFRDKNTLVIITATGDKQVYKRVH